MYILNKKMITGTVKIRNTFGEMKEIDRKSFIDFLEEEKEKEKDPIRKQDYQILIASIMGVDSLLIEKTEMKVVFNEESRWRGEAEANITDNNKLIQTVKKFLKKPKNVKIMGTLF